jgi:hypothetical protein
MAYLESLFMHINILEHVDFFALHFFFYLISVLHMHCINFVCFVLFVCLLACLFVFFVSCDLLKQKKQKKGMQTIFSLTAF